MAPASSSKASRETACPISGLAEDDEFIDLDIHDWPVFEVSDDSPECLSPRVINVVKDQTGKKLT
jgi:hypothetical protein